MKIPFFKNRKIKENNQEALAANLQKCTAERNEWKNQALRASADLNNFQRRISKEQMQWRTLAQADILKKLLPIVDNFDRAVEHDPENEGVNMLHKSFHDLLKDANVKEVAYETFDPQYHEALLQVDSEDKESGFIVAVMEKGYTLDEHVLRPAKVSVAK